MSEKPSTPFLLYFLVPQRTSRPSESRGGIWQRRSVRNETLLPANRAGSHSGSKLPHSKLRGWLETFHVLELVQIAVKRGNRDVFFRAPGGKEGIRKPQTTIGPIVASQLHCDL